ncbi:MAG TPA: BPSS1780 family membrane protein [Burkholderiales bacterium]|nr:BPSS1780 family membrane protein [Burkholderiales bacterium]
MSNTTMNVIDLKTPRAVAAGRGWTWIVEGFGLFRKSALVWVVLTIALAALWLAAILIPVIGLPVFDLLLPLFYAGLMIGCRAVESGDELEIGHLFAGFQKHASALVTIGGVYLIGNVIIEGIAHASGADMLINTLLTQQASDIATMSDTVRSASIALIIGLAIYLPIMMLFYFSPLLVVFDGVPAVPAMKSSFIACCRNWQPFLVFGVVAAILWFIALLPFFLGLLVLFPVLICANYAGYKDIYGERRD